MPRRRTALPIVLLALSAGGCRAIECPPPEPSRSIIAWQPARGAPREISGLVLSLADGRPVTAAQVRLSVVDSAWHNVTSEGRFRLRRASDAPVALEVRAPRYASATLALALRSDSAIALVAVMARVRLSRADAACGRQTRFAVDTVE